MRSKQHKILNKWFGVCRKVYNNGVALLREEHLSYGELNKRLVTSDSLTEEEKKYMLEVPTRMRKGAVEQLWDAYQGYLEKRKKDSKARPPKFRSYKALKESMVIKKETAHLVMGGRNDGKNGFLFQKKNGSYRPGKKFRGQDIIISPESDLCKNEPLTISCKPSIIQKIREMKSRDELSDMTLIRSKWVNRYWLCIPYKITIPTTESFPDNILAIDPGVRTFQTWYRSDGSFGKNGDEARKRLQSMNRKISNLQSQLDKMPKTSKQYTKERNKKILKSRETIGNKEKKTLS